MEANIKVIIKMEKSMDKEHIFGQMVVLMMDSGEKIS